MTTTYIFDTNPIYYLGNNDVVSDTARDAVRKAHAQDRIRLRYTPVAVIEMGTRIHEDPEMFPAAKKGAALLLECGATCLPDPEQLMAEIALDRSFPSSAYDFWERIFQAYGNAGSADEILKGFDDYRTLEHIKVDLAYLTSFRNRYEKQYVSDMARVVSQINPKFGEQVERGKMTKVSKEDAKALERFLASEAWKTTVLGVVAKRSKVADKVPLDGAHIIGIEQRLGFFREAWANHMLRVFRDGYQPTEKRKNDYNDVHMFLYVAPHTSDLLVTDDGNMKKLAVDPTRVVTTSEFLAAL